jgi:hypothetical protein
VDIELILDAAEIIAPTLKDTARRILTATARDMDVSVELSDVLARRAGGWPEVHLITAADVLLTHLLATEENMLDEESTLMTLARIGAQAIMTRAEPEEGHRERDVGRPFRINGDTL